ncbi:transglycosylase SLT domain-containing protein [Ottowia sp.]|uniref:lytic transglycosylase domain-containing protein n=1 Tax=Ottowia sp. TaxID=1898956 RepID=UPI003C753C65
MYFPKILTLFSRPLVVLACGILWTGLAAAQQSVPAEPVAAPAGPASDSVILDMREAYRRGDKARLAALLPAARGHALEPWAAYWELKARLEDASVLDVQDFLARYPGTYQEDRLRNDWLLLSGKRRDWQSFAAEWPRFRMQDDREVRCYAVAMELAQGRSVSADTVAEVRRDWFAQRDLDDGCLLAADLLHQAGKLPFNDLWMKARLAMENNRPSMARAAVGLDAPDVAPVVAQIQNGAMRYLASRAAVGTRKGQELIVLALIKLAAQDPDQAAAQLEAKWSVQLRPEENHWLWGVIGRQAALKLQDNALQYFSKVKRDKDLSDDMLAWKARAAMRQGQWRTVGAAVEAMSAEAQKEPIWVYWRARALNAQARSDADRALPRQLLESIAGVQGFYEKLAQEELGRVIAVPAVPPPLTDAEKAAARGNPGLNRGLIAIGIGLRSEGVREWNYTTNLHTPGGMADRELYAAADLACQREVWDRCINTSERTRAFMDFSQRFPMPYRDAVVKQSRSIGLDPAYVYGLIRQESRFIIAARSGVGASGLMQVMPATARWTARKIGLTGFTPDQIYQHDTNILIGTSYLKLALDDFQDSLPLAAAAYNAGPGRPRVWRAPGGTGPTLEGAIWAENIPFSETRDYVKKVLSNTVDYAGILSGKPQSLKERLGTVGPLPPNTPDMSKELVSG